jgi:glycosyltransferase involved in cell wall biosynthesis
MAAQVSIFIPAYNVEAYISKAIESVLAQSYDDWNLLIIDDCSRDRTFQIASSYQNNPKIKVVRNETNLGMLANWNRGISMCDAPFFVKLDADDYWHSEMLTEAMAVLEQNPEVGLTFTKFVNVNAEGAVMPDSEIQIPEFAREKSFSCIPLVKMGANKMLQYPILRQGLSVMRKKIFEEIGYYRHLLSEATQSSTDTEFYFRVGCHYNIFCIDKVLYYYRVHTNSVSSIDRENGLSELKLFETKSVINNYYRDQKKISLAEWKNNKREIEFTYKRYLLYKYRRDKKFGKFLSNFIRTFIAYPVKTAIFYKGRILNQQ